jgi:hypothetical protein
MMRTPASLSVSIMAWVCAQSPWVTATTTGIWCLSAAA